jgi:PPM family protein phosphatase
LPLIARAASLTDIGRTRHRNEDAVRVDVALGLAAVADGMGGHPSGDLASSVAIETLVEHLRAVSESGLSLQTGRANASGVPSAPTKGPAATPEPTDRPPATSTSAIDSPGVTPTPAISERALGAAMAEAVRSADRAVRRAAREEAARREMGTTLTALLLPPGAEQAVIGHVGDSRVYRFRSGVLELLTRDHSWVWDQVVAGLLTPDQAWAHPRRNLLTHALGVDVPAEPDVLEVDARPGDVFLLCSDGLSGMLRDSDIESVLRERLPEGLDPSASALVEEANRLGGKDNVTVALVEVVGDG